MRPLWDGAGGQLGADALLAATGAAIAWIIANARAWRRDGQQDKRDAQHDAISALTATIKSLQAEVSRLAESRDKCERDTAELRKEISRLSDAEAECRRDRLRLRDEIHETRSALARAGVPLKGPKPQPPAQVTV